MTGARTRRVSSYTDRTQVQVRQATSKGVHRRYRKGTAAAVKRGTARERSKSRLRDSAFAIGRGYVLFLIVVAVLTVGMCVSFIRMKQMISSQSATNDALQIELTTLRAENDAMYTDLVNSVDLSHVREVAMNTYHMRYATQDQIVYYDAVSNGGYVRQYQSVP